VRERERERQCPNCFKIILNIKINDVLIRASERERERERERESSGVREIEEERYYSD
jgi:hypothetical protein